MDVPVKTPSDDEIAFRTIKLEKRRFALEYVVSEDALMMQFSDLKDETRREMRCRLEGAIFEELDRHVKIAKVSHIHPKTWWDAFKDRWFPSWLAWMFPVEYETFNFPGVDQPLYKACYINMPHVRSGSSLYLMEIDKPDVARAKWGGR